ncbi:MAG: ribose-5-phosphate isomerase RpiA [Methylocystis sp.]
MTMSPADQQKRAASAAAMKFVRPGMKLGLGTGSTAAHFVDLLGAAGHDAPCVPTSEATRAHAARLGLELATLDECPNLDLTIDGADEFDEALRLIKGGGGALLREKIVAAASDRMIVIADASKRVKTLGAFPLPVEIDRFGAKATRLHVEAAARELGLQGKITLREKVGAPFITDGGHLILDCAFGAIADPQAFSTRLDAIPGVVEHGLFIGLATTILCAGENGVEVLGEAA